MPNLGKRKKQAKDSKDNHHHKSKSLHPQQTFDTSSLQQHQPNPRRRTSKAISSLIRSFTIDSLGRKAKNKSYELPREQLREEDIVLKETQHGMVKQLLTRDDESQVYEERFCRIRGKQFNPLVPINLLYLPSLKKALVESS